MLKRLLRHPVAQIVLAYALHSYLSVVYRTTRWHLEGVENFSGQSASGAPLIVCFWHERLPTMPVLWRMERQLPGRHEGPREIHALVSQHRDGRFVGAVVRRFGVGPVLGSSSRGGAAGLRVLLGLLRRGCYVVITPDGPLGPRRQAAAGVAQLAALSGIPVMPCAAQTTRRFVLNTWDRMVIPKPFGRGVVVCGATISVRRYDWEKAVPAITAALDAVTERADRLCA